MLRFFRRQMRRVLFYSTGLGFVRGKMRGKRGMTQLWGLTLQPVPVFLRRLTKSFFFLKNQLSDGRQHHRYFFTGRLNICNLNTFSNTEYFLLLSCRKLGLILIYSKNYSSFIEHCYFSQFFRQSSKLFQFDSGLKNCVGPINRHIPLHIGTTDLAWSQNFFDITFVIANFLPQLILNFFQVFPSCSASIVQLQIFLHLKPSTKTQVTKYKWLTKPHKLL